MRQTKMETKNKQKKTEEKIEKKNSTSIVETIPTRGRIFEGHVTKKFPKRVVIEFERPVYIRKYERYLKLKTKLHARLPDELESQVSVGDFIQIRECRPLSKIIHFMVVKRIRLASEEHKNQSQEHKDKEKNKKDKQKETTK